MKNNQQQLSEQSEQHRKAIAAGSLLLGSVTQTLHDLLARLTKGEAEALKGVSKKVSELETLLRQSHEIERRYDEWQAKQRGDLAKGEVDFDAVRAEIGRRIARLVE